METFAFDHGDFARPRPTGNTHIVQHVGRDHGRSPVAVMACGKEWRVTRLVSVGSPGEDPPRPCHACWDAM